MEIVSEAKVRLLDDIKGLNLASKPPHIPLRRVGEGQLANEVDDILSLLFLYLDEAKTLDKLPIYVTSSLDNVSSSHDEGDLQFLMTYFNNMNDRLGKLGATLATISSHVAASAPSAVNQVGQWSSATAANKFKCFIDQAKRAFFVQRIV